MLNYQLFSFSVFFSILVENMSLQLKFHKTVLIGTEFSVQNVHCHFG